MAAGAAKTSATIKRMTGKRIVSNSTASDASGEQSNQARADQAGAGLVGELSSGQPEQEGKRIDRERVGENAEKRDQRNAHEHYRDHDPSP